ncbi:pif1 [Symbiodinium sp. CCMP2592]|nr:pif1 [Symbiodinium sp. CCMP2592]
MVWTLKSCSTIIDLDMPDDAPALKNARTSKTSVKKERLESIDLDTTDAAPAIDNTIKPGSTAKKERSDRCFNPMLLDKWKHHEGHGLCRGVDGDCRMGSCGGRAPAGPSGWCDLCNLNDIPELHYQGGGRLTHLLLQLQESESELALKRIEDHIDADIAAECRERMERTRKRRAANRPVRRSRGTYKKKPNNPCQGLDGRCLLSSEDTKSLTGSLGLCPLCDLANIPVAHQSKGLLTRLLMKLEAPEADLAINRIAVQHSVIAEECRVRLQRAFDRRKPTKNSRRAAGKPLKHQ